MDAFVVCPDALIARRIYSGLEQVGIAGAPLDASSLDRDDAGGQAEPGPVLALVGSARFAEAEFRAIRELYEFGGERMKLVAVGPHVAPEIILEIIRAGAADYLDVSADFDMQLHRLVDRLRAPRMPLPRAAMLHAFVSPCGGSGASFLAANLAVALASLEQSCGLLDLKVRGGDLAMMLKCTSRHTLLSLATKASSLDRAMFEQSLVRHESGVHLLCSPEPFEDAQFVDGALISRVIQLARDMFPQVVVEFDDPLTPDRVNAIGRGGHVLIPFRPDFISLCRAKKYLDYFLEARIPRDRVIMIANRMGQSKEVPLERMEEVLETKVAHCIPDDPLAVNASINLGIPLVLENPKSRASRSIIHLAESLNGLAKAHPKVPAPKKRQSFFQTIARMVGTEQV